MLYKMLNLSSYVISNHSVAIVSMGGLISI